MQQRFAVFSVKTAAVMRVCGIAMLFVVNATVALAGPPVRPDPPRQSALARTPASARPSALNKELLVNGDAEMGGASDDSHIVPPGGWTTKGGFTAATYGARRGYFPGWDETPFASPPANLGKFFFAGGPGKDSSASQSVDLRGAAGAVASGNVTATLSAYIGGWYTQSDYGTVELDFFGKDGRSLCGRYSCFEIGPVTRADRLGASLLMKRSCAAKVPNHATRALVTMEAHWFSGGYNDAYFDSVSLKLGARAPKVAPCGTPLKAQLNEGDIAILVQQLDPPTSPPAARKAGTTAKKSIAAMVMSYLLGDTSATRCLRINGGILGALGAFLLGTLTWKLLRWAGLRRRYMVRFTCSFVVAALLFYLMFGYLARSQLGEFRLGDLGCLNQPWLFPSVSFTGMFSFFAVVLTWIYRRRRRADQEQANTPATTARQARRRAAWARWRRRWWRMNWRSSRWSRVILWRKVEIGFVYVDVAIAAAFLALIALIKFPPSAVQLDAFNRTLIICCVAMIYAAIAFAPSMDAQGIPRVIRVGLLLLLLAPTFQPLEDAAILSRTEQQRYVDERVHATLVARENGPVYDNIVFQTPDHLDANESGRVIFTAQKVGAASAEGCVTPLFVAPGFDVAAVLDEPVLLAGPKLAWEWIITPKRTGSHDVFASVLFSPKCRKYSTTGGTGSEATTATAAPAGALGGRPTLGQGSADRPGYDPVFTTRDTIYVSRPWYSVDYLNAISGSLSAIIAIVTTIFGLFGLRRKDEAAAPAAAPAAGTPAAVAASDPQRSKEDLGTPLPPPDASLERPKP